MSKFVVYRNEYFQGETFASSEQEAINNVRHRIFGESESQFENDWTAVNVDKAEEAKAWKEWHRQKEKAIRLAKERWPVIPEGSTVEVFHQPCEFYPMMEGEPDRIARGKVDGHICDLGFVGSDEKPSLYRPFQEYEPKNPDEQLSIFEF